MPPSEDLISTLRSQLPTIEWEAAIAYGLIFVIAYSWARFDQPTYSQIRYFSKYKPQFATSHFDYILMKSIYVIITGAIFVIASFILTLLDTNNPLTSPIAIAAYVVTLQNVPGLVDVERFVRAGLHASAKIPQGVRQTAEQMYMSEFRFDMFDTQRLCLPLIRTLWGANPAEEGKIVSFLQGAAETDKVFRAWLLVACLLSSLSNRNGSKLRLQIKQSFIDEYQYELESIAASHAAIFSDVGLHVAALSRQEPDDPTALATQLEELKGRLFAFVACGVRSSVDTEIQSAEILQRLGFVGNFSAEHGRGIADLGLLLGIFILFTAVLFVGSVELLPDRFRKILGIPEGAWNGVAFFMCSAIFYVASILGSLYLREKRMSRVEWFDLNDMEINIPLRKYPTLIVAGVTSGLLVLFVIALSCGPGFPCDPKQNRLDHLLTAANHVWQWFPVASLLSAASLWASDSAQISDEARAPVKEFTLQSLAVALLMALTLAFCNVVLLGPPPVQGLDTIELMVILAFFPIQGALLSGTLLFIVQLYFYDRTDPLRRLLRRRIATPHERIFYIVFHENRRADWFCDQQHLFDGSNAVRQGHWLRFPEGIVVVWLSDNIENFPGDVGLVSQLEGEMLYRAYDREISLHHLWLIQLDTRRMPG